MWPPINDLDQPRARRYGEPGNRLRLEIVPAVDERLPDEETDRNTRTSSGNFDVPAAVVALRDALVTANRIVEVMARPGGSTRSTRKHSLFVQVSEIELATANLLHGLARLRRTLSD